MNEPGWDLSQDPLFFTTKVRSFITTVSQDPDLTSHPKDRKLTNHISPFTLPSILTYLMTTSD